MKKVFQLFKIINTKYPLSLWIFITVFIASSILESIGISLVIPIIALLLDPNFLLTLEDSTFSNLVPDFIFSFDNNEAMIFFCTSIIIVYILKSFFIYLSVYNISIFTGRVKAFLTNKLMFNYLHQDYLYYTSKNLSDINQNVNQRVNDVCDGVVQSVLYIVSEGIILLAMIILILLFGQADVFAILLGFFSFGIFSAKLLNSKVSEYGLTRQKEQDLKFEKFTKLLNNIREILLIGKFKFAFKDFYRSLYSVAILDAKRQALQRSPGLILEVVGVISLVTIVFYLRHLEYSSTNITAICAFFAAASYRAIPSLHKIVFYNYGFRFYYPAFLTLSDEIKLKDKIVYHEEKTKFLKKLELVNIKFKYSTKDDFTLNNISLTIEKGKKIGIYGESGSGKTTLLDIISGLIKTSDGELIVDGIKINNDYLLRKHQNNISYTSQKTSLLNDSLKKNICFGVEEELIDEKKYREVLHIAQLEDFEKTLVSKNFKLNDTGKNISGGQLQRIGIARALYRDNDIMIFDEATSSLDLKTANSILDNIHNQKSDKTIILVSHNLLNLKSCDYLYEFKNSEIKLVE